ncbi:DUF1707 and DUF4190 domain-containing protein [Plantactinospora sp. S1510]|uniref:DUF1707 and DUF4190 domain-containing protein n=1 Tax=Plantactinospora alkalitolerans TaxID=2789879 RepID=A0ABS0H096_9ACTN|nr:DUF1707 and DUF4190 domain-containing protein [Plantactinospora alkalitolerans]MBF9131886.1 DUF1707 and DUF4190 domain-containing protein [Plantactinospora alkalitolerans]
MNERVGTAQRTQVVGLLSEALGQGYLDLTEYDQRMSAATSAKTVAELSGQVADLPPQFQWDPRRVPPPAAPRSASPSNTSTASVASLVLGITSIPLAICLGVGGLFGLAAVVLGRSGMRGTGDHGKALTGLILGCLGILSSIFVVLVYFFAPDTPPAQ